MAGKFVLLDRDGVINRRIPGRYVTAWSEFLFLPTALEGLRVLKEGGYAVAVVSNQAGVGKGLLSAQVLDEITRRFASEVQEHGGEIRAVYYCTHRAEDRCDCRKPRPGLLQRAQAEQGFAFANTYLIGDSEVDLQAAYAVGCPVLLISDGGESEFKALPHRPRTIFRDLLGAARFLVRGEG